MTDFQHKLWPRLKVFPLASRSGLTTCVILQQDHTSSNKVIPPNSATPYEFMGPKYFQITTVTIQNSSKTWRLQLPDTVFHATFHAQIYMNTLLFSLFFLLQTIV